MLFLWKKTLSQIKEESLTFSFPIFTVSIISNILDELCPEIVRLL